MMFRIFGLFAPFVGEHCELTGMDQAACSPHRSIRDRGGDIHLSYHQTGESLIGPSPELVARRHKVHRVRLVPFLRVFCEISSPRCEHVPQLIPDLHFS